MHGAKQNHVRAGRSPAWRAVQLPSPSATGRIVEPPGPSILTLVWIEPAREQNRLLANQEE